MTVTMPEKDWPDSRLNDLKKAVDAGHEEMRAGFAKVDANFRDVRGDVASGFIRLDEKFDKKFDRLLFWILAGMSSSIVGILAILVTVIVRGS